MSIKPPSPCTPGAGYPTSPDRCLDADKGLSIRRHEGTDQQLFMYKTEPGLYLNAFGNEVSEKIAREAGFDVEKFSRQRLRSERLADAAAIVDAEMAQADNKEAVKIAEHGGFAIMDVGFNRFVLETSEGDRVTPRAVTLAVAQSLLSKLSGSGPDASAAVQH
jgi:hypothetical protein